MNLNLSLLIESGETNDQGKQNQGSMEKGKHQILLGSDLVLVNADLYSPDSSDERSDLSEFSGTSSSIELTENSSEEEQVSLISFSKE